MAEHVEAFARRVIEDALAEATAHYWIRRAEQLEAAVSRPGDYMGRTSAQEVAERDQRLKESAQSCRRHAAFCLLGGFKYDDE